jgi:outer membrane biosynthesis protein TonB
MDKKGKGILYTVASVGTLGVLALNAASAYACKPTSTPKPTREPTEEPTHKPTCKPTEQPTQEPTEEPTYEPTEVPTEEPTEEPTYVPTEQPTEEPTWQPTGQPTEVTETYVPTQIKTPKPHRTPVTAVPGGAYDMVFVEADNTFKQPYIPLAALLVTGLAGAAYTGYRSKKGK